MRADVKTLLERLGRSQFRYKEFADRFSDLETWPVFEAVIRDPRVFDHASTIAEPAAPSRPANIAPLGSVFSQKYGGGNTGVGPGGGGPGASRGSDVRSLLARISSAVDQGEI